MGIRGLLIHQLQKWVLLVSDVDLLATDIVNKPAKSAENSCQ